MKLASPALVTVLTAWLCAQAMTGVGAQKQGLDSRVRESLSWLPADTQSIAVTSMVEGVLTNRDVDIFSPDFGWQLLLLQPTWVIDEQMRPHDTALCIETVCSPNRKPKDGSNPSCQFLYLTDNTERDEKLKAFIKKIGVATYEEDGTLISQLKAPKYSEDSRVWAPYLICMPRPGLVVGSTNKQLLGSVLQRIHRITAQGTTGEALPASLPEWSYADVQAPFWGLRHFAAKDPTSPAAKLDRGAIGMTFSYTPADHTALFTYLSSGSALKTVAQALTGLDKGTTPAQKVAYKTLSKGVLQISLQDSSEDIPERMWDCLAYWLGDRSLPDEVLRQ